MSPNSVTKLSPTWFQVARRPKWLGALLVALLVAVVCALLAGWQASRSIEQVLPAATQVETVPIDEVLTAGEPLGASAVGTQVSVTATLDTAHTWVVANRVQRDGTRGYWVVGDYRTAGGGHLVATLGFTTDVKVALKAVRDLRAGDARVSQSLTGRLAQTEPPILTQGAVLPSLSLAQLVNLISNVPVKVYPLFLLRTGHDAATPLLNDLTVAPIPTEAQINFLSAFYALEWIFFCGFSVFIWWRLVRDAQLIEAGVATPKRTA